MTEPWWRPIADALAKRVAKAIKDYEPTEDDKVRVLDAAFEDVPAKAPPKRTKALPARLDTPTVESPPDDEK